MTIEETDILKELAIIKSQLAQVIQILRDQRSAFGPVVDGYPTTPQGQWTEEERQRAAALQAIALVGQRGETMTDWEKAIAHWLPKVWTPGSPYGDMPYEFRSHSIDYPCPPATPELGFRLLEAMIMQCGYDYVFNEVAGHGFSGRDLLTAIIKAAAALAEKSDGTD